MVPAFASAPTLITTIGQTQSEGAAVGGSLSATDEALDELT